MKKSAPNGKVRFPVTVERGPTGLKGKATIHWTPATVGGERYDSYTVIFYVDGKRQRQRFSDYAKAYAKAEEVATKRSNGESEALSLSGDDRRRYVDALNLLAILKRFHSILRSVNMPKRARFLAKSLFGTRLIFMNGTGAP